MGNRCHAETYLASRLSELDRHGWRFGAAFFDVDHFKRVNDTGGHEVGDRVLRMVATTGRNSLMASDVVSRRGGRSLPRSCWGWTGSSCPGWRNRVTVG